MRGRSLRIVETINSSTSLDRREAPALVSDFNSIGETRANGLRLLAGARLFHLQVSSNFRECCGVNLRWNKLLLRVAHRWQSFCALKLVGSLSRIFARNIIFRYAPLALATIIFLSSTNCANAIAYKIEKFSLPKTADLEKWKDVLTNFPGANVKSADFLLLGKTHVSVLRIESAACKNDVCPTVFRYNLNREYTFTILCKEVIQVFDEIFKISGDEFVQSIQVYSDRAKITVTMTSFGPIIGVSRP